VLFPLVPIWKAAAILPSMELTRLSSASAVRITAGFSYDLLGQHGWCKLMPRPFHPQQDLAAQKGFTKTAFLALSRRHPAQDGLPTHSRVHLFVWCGRSQGRHLRLSDHADSDTTCFQAFLDVLSRKFARQDILLVLDGVPNHAAAN
jgi:hypothetical protein